MLIPGEEQSRMHTHQRQSLRNRREAGRLKKPQGGRSRSRLRKKTSSRQCQRIEGGRNTEGRRPVGPLRF